MSKEWLQQLDWTQSKLDLSSRKIQSEDIASILITNTCLTDLNLANNVIFYDCDVLAHALEKNSTLKTLDLSANWGDVEDYCILVGALGAGLKNNVSITSLGKELDDDLSLSPLLYRNQCIRSSICRCIWLLIGIRQFHPDDPSAFSCLPRDIVMLIARQVWATRGQLVWLN